MDFTLRRAVQQIVAMAPGRAWESYVASDEKVGRVGTRCRWIVQLVRTDAVELSARYPRERRGERLLRHLHTESELDLLARELLDLLEWWADRVTVHSLVQGRSYRVDKGFVDCAGQAFRPREELTFVERHFLPYDGGHTVVFRQPDGSERRMYLQEDNQSELLEDLDVYLVDA